MIAMPSPTDNTLPSPKRASDFPRHVMAYEPHSPYEPEIMRHHYPPPDYCEGRREVEERNDPPHPPIIDDYYMSEEEELAMLANQRHEYMDR